MNCDHIAGKIHTNTYRKTVTVILSVKEEEDCPSTLTFC